jgi:hypothetical protein
MFSYTIMFSVEDLSREIVDLAAHLDAATHRLLTCIRQFDEGGGSAVERRRETSVPRWSGVSPRSQAGSRCNSQAPRTGRAPNAYP